MNSLFAILLLLFCLYGCNYSTKSDNTVINETNFLRDITPFNSDSLVNVVIEIPAGSRQKWEVNKETGQIEWEKISPDSFRVVNYLPYPANYGFVPQTLLPKASGGDGDPVDVFVLGSTIVRNEIVKVRILGIIHMLDNDESDAKLLAVNANEPGFDVTTFDALNTNYPGIIDIIKLWLQHYKGSEKVEIHSVKDEKDALQYLKTAVNEYLNHK